MKEARKKRQSEKRQRAPLPQESPTPTGPSSTTELAEPADEAAPVEKTKTKGRKAKKDKGKGRVVEPEETEEMAMGGVTTPIRPPPTILLDHNPFDPDTQALEFAQHDARAAADKAAQEQMVQEFARSLQAQEANEGDPDTEMLLPGLPQKSQEDLDFVSGIRQRMTLSGLGTFTPKNETRAAHKRGRALTTTEEPGSPSAGPRKKSNQRPAAKPAPAKKTTVPIRNKSTNRAGPSGSAPTGPSRPELDTGRTRRGLAEIAGGETRTSMYADGHHIYIRLPRELRAVEDGGSGLAKVTSRGMIETLEVGLNYGIGAILFAARNDKSSWIAKFASREHAEFFDGMNCGYGDTKWTVQTSLYRGAGARTFVAARCNNTPPEVMIEEIGKRLLELNLGTRVKFWLGLQFYRGARGAAAVIWFTQPPEISEFKVYFPEVGGKKDRFLCKFLAANLSKVECEICEQSLKGVPHGILRCPDLLSASPAPPSPPASWLQQLPGTATEG
ncbi:hypothetical protein N431DRAFT_430649 [Stipitochalara longipes BDJ]|nr:hypothetical protein N431DRAFT_430649 [Stipitochalara longipes BDJ]